MGGRTRLGAPASFLLLAVSCATTTEITLPALDASKTMLAEALVVQSDYSRGFNAPSRVVRGAGEGATTAMAGYIGGTASAGGEGALIGLLLAPIGLPLSAAIGAGMAHSEEEVDAAAAGFSQVGQDKKLFASIDRRFIKSLDRMLAKQWNCFEAVSEAITEPCQGYSKVAHLRLRPAFKLEQDGAYNPDIKFLGDVVVRISLELNGLDVQTDDVLEAKWAYREELGKFFELGKDNATLLRRKVEDILDRFAARIAEDLYLTPQPELIKRKEEFSGRSFIEIPPGVVVRVEQGSDLPSLATHGLVRPKARSFGEECWIDAIDGSPTGQSYSTSLMKREVAVKAGRTLLVVSCITDRGSVNEKLAHHRIEISIEPDVTYVTDGRSYQPLKR